jgi:hypothetical protein
VGVAYPGVCDDKHVLDSCLTLLSMKLSSTGSMLLLQPVVVLPGAPL